MYKYKIATLTLGRLDWNIWKAILFTLKNSKNINLNLIGRNYLFDELKKFNLKIIPSVTNFITIIFDKEDIAKEFLSDMLKNGIILRGLKSFGLPNCVRVTIGTKDENKYLVEILNKII